MVDLTPTEFFEKLNKEKPIIAIYYYSKRKKYYISLIQSHETPKNICFYNRYSNKCYLDKKLITQFSNSEYMIYTIFDYSVLYFMNCDMVDVYDNFKKCFSPKVDKKKPS